MSDTEILPGIAFVLSFRNLYLRTCGHSSYVDNGFDVSRLNGCRRLDCLAMQAISENKSDG